MVSSLCHSFTAMHTTGRNQLVTKKKVVANQMGNTNFALMTNDYQMVVDWSLGLCDSGLIALTLHCHMLKMVDNLKSRC